MVKTKPLDLDPQELREAVEFVTRGANALRYLEKAKTAGELILGLLGNIKNLEARVADLNIQAIDLDKSISLKKSQADDWDQKIEGIKKIYDNKLQEAEAVHSVKMDGLKTEFFNKEASISKALQIKQAEKDGLLRDLQSQEDNLRGKIAALEAAFAELTQKAKSVELPKH